MAYKFKFASVGERGEAYPEWITRTADDNGVYLIRDAATKRLLYVGSSSKNSLYSTVTRHLQTWRRSKKFWKGRYSEDDHDPGMTYPRGSVEVAVRVMSSDIAALNEEMRLIETLRPRDNITFQAPMPEPDDDEAIPF